jgi:hypothetical protein
MSRLRRIVGLLGCVSLLVPAGSSWARTTSSARLVALQAGLAAPEAAQSKAAALLNDPRFQEEAKRIQSGETSEKSRDRR